MRKTIHGQYKEDSMKYKDSKWVDQEAEEKKESQEFTRREKHSINEEVRERTKVGVRSVRLTQGGETVGMAEGDDLESQGQGHGGGKKDGTSSGGPRTSPGESGGGNRRAQGVPSQPETTSVDKDGDGRLERRDRNVKKTYSGGYADVKSRREDAGSRRTYSEGTFESSVSRDREIQKSLADYNANSRTVFYSSGSLGEEGEEEGENADANLSDDQVDTTEISDAITEFRRVRHQQIRHQLERQQQLQQQQQQQQQQRNLDRSSSHGILSRQPPHNRGIKKCKSATFSLDGMQYTIGECFIARMLVRPV